MNAFVKTGFLGSLLGGCILLGCDSSTGSGPSDSVAGTWKGIAADSTMTMVFQDSTFSGMLPNFGGTFYVSGTYSFKHSAISLKYASGHQGEESIPLPSPDSVGGTLVGSKMTLPIPYGQEGDSVTLTKQ